MNQSLTSLLFLPLLSVRSKKKTIWRRPLEVRSVKQEEFFYLNKMTYTHSFFSIHRIPPQCIPSFVTSLIVIMSMILPLSTCVSVPPLSWSLWANEQTCHCTNAVRYRYGLHALYAGGLVNQCIGHSAWMAENNILMHQDLSSMHDVLAENVVMIHHVSIHTNDLPNHACREWMSSQAHLRNMVSTRATHCSVGFARDSLGRFWATQMFSISAPSPPIQHHHPRGHVTTHRFISVPHTSEAANSSVANMPFNYNDDDDGRKHVVWV